MIAILGAGAQETSFRLSMDNPNLQEGVSATVVVSITNGQGAQVVEVEGIEDFDVFSQSPAASVASVGRAGRGGFYQEDYHYTIIPKASGQFS
jgi:hypothetical protein